MATSYGLGHNLKNGRLVIYHPGRRGETLTSDDPSITMRRQLPYGQNRILGPLTNNYHAYPLLI